MSLVVAAVIGLGIGFLGGLLGKGGSAVATPLLSAAGFPAVVAVAAPLPATIPSTLAAGYAYSGEHLVDWRVVRWSLACGVPATVVGAIATRWIDGSVLVAVTDGMLVLIGLRFLLSRTVAADVEPAAEPSRLRIGTVAGIVGVVSGLLANSGGFLLAPLFVTVLKMPIKRAFATSLAVASVLAIPGTVVHTWLGHVNWTLVAVFAATSIPLSFLGARVALRTDAARLERIYGAALVVLGVAFLATR